MSPEPGERGGAAWLIQVEGSAAYLWLWDDGFDEAERYVPADGFAARSGGVAAVSQMFDEFLDSFGRPPRLAAE